MRVLALVCLLLVLLGSVAAADGPVSVAASVDRRGITIGDPIGLVLVIETDPGYHITDSGVGRIMDEFEVLEAIPPQVTRIANGRTRYTFRYRITAFRVGDLVFPPISVAYQSPAGVPGVAPTTEIPIVITSVIQPGEITDDIKPASPLEQGFCLGRGERRPNRRRAVEPHDRGPRQHSARQPDEGVRRGRTELRPSGAVEAQSNREHERARPKSDVRGKHERAPRGLVQP